MLNHLIFLLALNCQILYFEGDISESNLLHHAHHEQRATKCSDLCTPEARAVLTVLCALSGDGTFQATQQHVPRGEPAVRHLLFHKQGELCLGLCGRKETAWEINYCVIRVFAPIFYYENFQT